MADASNTSPRFAGRWNLVSCVGTSGDDQMEPFGRHPRGVLVYTGDSVSVFMSHEERQPFPHWDARRCPDADVARSYHEIEAYYGRYTVDESQRLISHRVEGAKIPNIIGSDFVRRYELDDDRLVLSTVDPLPVAGRDWHLSLVWERASG